MKITAGSKYAQGKGTVYVSSVVNDKVFYHPIMPSGVCFGIEWSKTVSAFTKSVNAEVL